MKAKGKITMEEIMALKAKGYKVKLLNEEDFGVLEGQFDREEFIKKVERDENE